MINYLRETYVLSSGVIVNSIPRTQDPTVSDVIIDGEDRELTEQEWEEYIKLMRFRHTVRSERLDGHIQYFRGDTLLLNRHDSTPSVSHYRDGRNTNEYNSKCAACYLGHGHSRAYHNASVPESEAL